MSRIVRWAAENRFVALMLAAGIVIAGVLAYLRMPIDAVPDMTNVQVQVVTRAPALSAAEVEAQITQPLEKAMAGIPGLKLTRSATRLGISLVTLIFDDDVDVYFARAQANERLAGVREQIPPEVGTPELGPVTTALGEIYMFELKPTGAVPRSAEELRTIVEWQIAPRLRQLRGVVDVVGYGGAVKQYQVTLDPARLAAHAISVEEVREAIERDNVATGGGYIERNGEQVVLRGDARFRGIEDIASTLVRTEGDSTPVRVGQLGDVDTGAAPRQGAMTRDGRGEIVGASVFMLKGENSREVVARVKEAVGALTPFLPAGVAIDPYYDRADFIDRVLHTVSRNLSEGALLVVGTLLLTLGSVRAGLVVAGAIPFAMLCGILGLSAIGYSGNVMSLGSVDFGIVVEGAVVIVEHLLGRLGSPVDRDRRRRAVLRAMEEVARPVVFGVVIVLLVFLPLTTLEDVEGKMFRPVVYSLCFMLAGALFYALVVVPAIADWAFGRSREPREPWLSRKAAALYAPLLRHALARPALALTLCAAATVALFGVGSRLGAEFLPRIFEGSFCIDALRPPSVSLTGAVMLAGETERSLKETPEVKTVVDRIGRPEGAVDPSGPESSDVFVILAPRDEWRPGLTPEALMQELSRKVNARVPATIHSFSQPIEMRVNELIGGVKSDLAIKVFAEDLDTMTSTADAIRRTLMQVPGASDVKMEILSGLPSILVKTDRERAARLGIPSRAALDALEMTRAGDTVGRVREGERVFDLVLRLGGDQIAAPEDLARLPIATRQGKLVPLALVADVSEERTLVQIGREQMRRRLIVQANVRGRDMVGFVRDAQSRVEKLVLPKSVELEWGGQFQNFNRAKDRLGSLVPVAIGVIALMLVMTFRNVRFALVAVLNLPFAVAGGAAALVARGLPFSIPAGVGFIALCGVSVMNGVVMVTRLGDEPETLPPPIRIERAALHSLRAILSTAMVAAIGFVPAAIATGTGAEVQRPLATVVIGGLVSAMLLSLPALPTMLLLAVSGRRDVSASTPRAPLARASA
ncbi:MAG TPA: CusA/CzcA family heavy metal efflux RND transporter [Polyangiaceae bacterium]|jgi:cobalt-zinc-cadmium resistance protein CzcA|nr:CusA/CzcA family heavy metal efflux RND transporter [Polyangiaceae bacterium]